MDEINPNPIKDVVAYPERSDDISNEPLPDTTTSTDEDSTQSITFSEVARKSTSVKPPRKQLAGKKRPLNKSLPPPDPKTPKLDHTPQQNRTGSPSLQISDFSRCFT